MLATQTTIIDIGDSRGIRIPKLALIESGLEKEVELQVRKGEIRITSAPVKSTSVASTLLLSENALAADWDKPEENKAWASLQPSALRP